jgi:hypothetical protein
MPNQRAHRLPRAAAAASSDTMMVYELAKRSHDGLVVRLLWDPLRDQVVLRYRDLRNGEVFAARVPNERALDAFHQNAYRLACSTADA